MRFSLGVVGFFCCMLMVVPTCNAVGGDTWQDAVPLSIPYGYDFGDTSDPLLTDTPESIRTTRDVWYKIEVPENESCDVVICYSAPEGDCWDTYLSIWDDDPSVYSPLQSSDDEVDSCSSGWYGAWGEQGEGYCQSKISYTLTGAVGGTTYYLCCEGWAYTTTGEGEYCIELSGTCADCGCADATYIDCSTGSISGNTGLAPWGTNCWSSYPEVGCTWDMTGPEEMFLVHNSTTDDIALRMILTPGTGLELDLFVAYYDWCGSNYTVAYDDSELYLFLSSAYAFYTTVDGRGGDQGAFDLDVMCETFCEADGWPIYCGQKYTDQTTDLGRPSYWNTYDDDGTAPDQFVWATGQERIYILDIPDDSISSFTATISNHPTDLDVILMFDVCDNDMGFVTWGEESVTVASTSIGTYFIIVDSLAGEEGSFDLEVTCGQQLLNCSSSTTITCGSSVTGDTSAGGVNSNVEYYLCAPWEEAGPELVYDFTLSSAIDVTLVMTPEDIEGIDLDLFVLSACDEETCLYSSCTDYSVETIQQNMSAGLYYVVIDGYRGDSGPFDLTFYCGNTPAPTATITPTPTVTPSPPPTLTPTPTPELPLDCTSSIALTCGQYFFGDTDNGVNNAVHYNCEPGVAEIGKELVFEIDVPYTYEMTANMWPILGINLDLFLLSSCSQNACIAGSVNASGMETITETLSSGTYFLVVDGSREAEFTLTFSCPPETLDCSSVVPITCNTSYAGTTVGGNSDVSLYGCTGAESLEESGPEIVHVLTVTSGPLTLTLTPTDSDDLDLFLLSSCDQDNCLEYSSDGQGVIEIISTSFASNSTIYIVVDGYRGAMGDYTLLATCGSAPSPTPTTTYTATATPTPTYTFPPTSTPQNTSTPTQTPTITPTLPPTSIPTITPTPPPHATITPTRTPTPPLTPIPSTTPLGLIILLFVTSWIMLVGMHSMKKKKGKTV